MRKIPVRSIQRPFPTPKSRVRELNGHPVKVITYREYCDMLKDNWYPPTWE